MPHDELLVRIRDDEKFLDQYFGAKFKGQSALRAVVELHKPLFIETEGGEFALCDDCSRRVDLPGYGVMYPCKTIRSIEAELL